MTIKLGIDIGTSFPEDESLPKHLNNLIEQVRRAKANGFVSMWAAQHFLSRPLQMIQPLPLLARLLAEGEGMMVGPNILVLPLLNPVAVAEEAATMDFLSGGKYVVGVGLGYRDEEYTAFNVSRSERVGRFVEAIEIIRRLFAEDRVDYRGKYYTIPNMGLGMRAVRPGGPPIWIAASTDPAIERAARIGDAWLITFYPSLSLLRQQMKLYRSALKDAGKPAPEDMPILKECYVGKSYKTALDECRAPLQVKYDAYASWGQDKFLPENERFDQPFEEFVKDRFLIGDAAFVRDEIHRYHEELGVNHFMLRMHWPGLEQDKVLRTIDLLGERVVPVFA